MHYNALPHSLSHCNTCAECALWPVCLPHCNTLQRTAPHCNALQRTATHCNALHHVRRMGTMARMSDTLQCTTRHCTALPHSATHCNTCAGWALGLACLPHCNTLQRTATRTTTHCHTLPHTATHCHTLRRVRRMCTIAHMPFASPSPI